MSICCVSLLLALGLTLFVKFLYGSIPFMTCSPFIDPSKSVVWVDIITWIATIFQLTISVVIISLYTLMVTKLYQSNKNMQKSKKQSNVSTVIQVVVVCVSNIICWTPSGILFLVSLHLEKYPIGMVIWTTVAVIPINSGVNPSVFLVQIARKTKTLH